MGQILSIYLPDDATTSLYNLARLDGLSLTEMAKELLVCELCRRYTLPPPAPADPRDPKSGVHRARAVLRHHVLRGILHGIASLWMIADRETEAWRQATGSAYDTTAWINSLAAELLSIGHAMGWDILRTFLDNQRGFGWRPVLRWDEARVAWAGGGAGWMVQRDAVWER